MLLLLALAQVPQPPLPKPFDTPSVAKFAKVIGWPADTTPTAPPGFTVTPFAADLDSPRWLYVLPNGDVLVAQSRTLPPKKPEPKEKPEERKGKVESKNLSLTSANRITLLRDADGDGTPEVRESFLDGLNQPLGMALLGDTLFVANTDGVVAFAYTPGATKPWSCPGSPTRPRPRVPPVRHGTSSGGPSG